MPCAADRAVPEAWYGQLGLGQGRPWLQPLHQPLQQFNKGRLWRDDLVHLGTAAHHELWGAWHMAPQTSTQWWTIKPLLSLESLGETTFLHVGPAQPDTTLTMHV